MRNKCEELAARSLNVRNPREHKPARRRRENYLVTDVQIRGIDRFASAKRGRW
jgi:hypothetical protein